MSKAFYDNYYDFDELDDDKCFDDYAFNSEVEHFKNCLRKFVMQEVLNEIKQLKDELAMYKDIKDNWEVRSAELEKAKTAYEDAKVNLENELRKKIKKETLVSLLGNRVDGYGVAYSWDYVYPKCDKCDDNRRIHFKSPSGIDYTEPCKCSTKMRNFYTVDAVLSEVKSRLDGSTNFDGAKDEVVYSYKVESNREEAIVRKAYGDDINIEDEEVFKKLFMNHYYGIVFKSKERADKCCEIANAVELKRIKEET